MATVAMSSIVGADVQAIQRMVVRLREQRRRDPHDFAVENDLGVALALAAQIEQSPYLLVQALGAVVRAMALAPDEPVVLFNRALVLGYLQLSEPAATAWRDYLRADPDSPWAGEALDQLRLIERKLGQQLQFAENARGGIDAQLERHRLQEVVLEEWSALDDRDEARALLEHEFAAVQRLAGQTGDDLLLESYELLLESHLDHRQPLHRDLQEGHRLLAEAERQMRARSFAESEPLLVRARTLLTRSGSPFHLWAEHGLLRCAFHRDDFVEVEEIGRRILATAVPGSAIAGRTWWLLGSGRFGRGDFAPSEYAFRAALEAFARLGEENNRIAVVSMLASLQEWIGREEEAWKARFTVLQALSDGHDPRRLRMVLNGAAFSAADMGELEAALLLQDTAVSLAEREGHPLPLANALLKRAALMGPRPMARERAEEDFVRSASLIEQIEDPGDRTGMKVQLLLEWGRSDVAGGDAVAAIRRLTEALQLQEGDAPHLRLPEILDGLGRAQAAAGLDAEAEESLRNALAELDRQRRSVRGVFERVLLADRADAVHESLIRLLLDRGENGSAIAAVQDGHSDVWRIRTGEKAVATPTERYSQCSGPVPVLTYEVLAERLIIWLCNGEKLRLHQVHLTRADLNDLVANLRASLQSGSGGAIPLLRELHKVLIEPLAAELGETGKLLIMPDEALFGVPFAALVDAQGSFLVEKHAISIGVRSNPPGRPAPPGAGGLPKRILAVADPDFPQQIHPYLERLPAAKEEAVAIGRFYASVDLLTEKEATVREVLLRIAEADVIHFAAHGLSSVRDPLQSALVLAAATEEEDGLLTVDELLKVVLRRRPTVVLASCESFGGFLSKSSGPIGLARPLLESGASAVVATLWEINDDASGSLVIQLHDGIADGVPIDDSLRKAQLRVIQEGLSLGHWAPWVMVAAGVRSSPDHEGQTESTTDIRRVIR